jgi:hypothetical protein
MLSPLVVHPVERMTPPEGSGYLLRMSENQDEGQVSEVAGLGDGGPISDGDAVAGQPSDESGEVDEGPTGPDAPTDHRDDKGDYPDKDDVETTG